MRSVCTLLPVRSLSMRFPTLSRAAAALLLCSTSLRAEGFLLPAHDLILRGGRVVDGTGNPWRYADVGIDGDRITEIGDLSDRTAIDEFDARGLVVAPGFIDVHTHVDDDIHKYPLAENFVRDGVTTIVSGNCGGSVLDVRRFFDRLENEGSAVNNATLVGHNSILREVKGASVAGKLTDAQMTRAKELVATAMRGGAIGFSTGLIYTPGTWSDTDEIIEMAKVAGAMGGIYATHMRSETGEILAAIDEALRVGREARMRVEISHFKIGTATALRFGRGETIKAGSDVTLQKVLDARAAGEEVWLDQYPYTASSTTLSTLLPDWVLEKGGDAAQQALRDPEQVKKVLADMRENQEVRNKRTDLSYAVVASAPKHPELDGMSIKQIAQRAKFRVDHPDGVELLAPTTTPTEGAPRDGHRWASADVTMDDQYRAVIGLYLEGGASCVFHSMDEIEVGNIMRSPLVGVASDSGVRVFGQGVPHPRGYGTNARVLGRYVRDLHVISLEEAVRKMTSMPATAFRMTDRGTLRVGAFADVTVFDAGTVADRSTFDKPHQFPVGIRAVFTNGTPVFDGDKMTGAKPGKPIRGPAYVATTQPSKAATTAPADAGIVPGV